MIPYFAWWFGQRMVTREFTAVTSNAVIPVTKSLRVANFGFMKIVMMKPIDSAASNSNWIGKLFDRTKLPHGEDEKGRKGETTFVVK